MVRLKHRYLLVHILYPDTASDPSSSGIRDSNDVPCAVQFHQPTPDRVNARSLTQAVRNGVADLFGDYGSGMTSASVQIKYFSPATSTAIIRVSRDHYRLVWAALTVTLRLPKPSNHPCVFQVVRVSGTIKKAEEEAIRRAQNSIRKVQRVERSNFLSAAEDSSTAHDVMQGIGDADEYDDEGED